MVENNILPSVKKGTYFQTQHCVKKQDSNFSKNRCCISKLKMVKKTNSTFSKHRGYTSKFNMV